MSSDGSISAKEKRRYTRIDSRLNVHFRIDGNTSEKIYRGTTCNISCGGLCLQIEQGIDELLMELARVSLPLKLSVELTEKDEPVEVEAVSRWSSSVMEWIHTPQRNREVIHAGVAFRKISDSTKKKIEKYLENRETGASKKHEFPAS